LKCEMFVFLVLADELGWLFGISMSDGLRWKRKKRLSDCGAMEMVW